jgi:hypothetical protein
VTLRSTILASACILAVGAFAVPAYAQFDGVLSGDYAHLDANNGGGSANSYGVSGSGIFGFGSSLAGEVDGGYHHLSGGGSDTNDWNVDGSLIWRGMWGRAGAVIGYNSSDAGGGGGNLNVTNYGGFAEWYAGHAFTVGVKGGGFSASHATDGDYIGVAVTGYVMPDLALSGGYDYTHLQHAGNENDWSANAEWLVSESTPISIYAGYTNSRLTGFGGGETINVWGGGIKFYLDQPGPATLVDRQRAGAATWGTSFGPTVLKF